MKSFHTHDTTVWFKIAYGTPLPLWRIIPHRWLTRPCRCGPGTRDGCDSIVCSCDDKEGHRGNGLRELPPVIDDGGTFWG